MANFSHSRISSELIKYKGSMGPVDAYISRPDDGSPRPAIVVIHDIWGLSDHTKDVADRFASNGYVALAPALYSSNQEIYSILTPQSVAATTNFMRGLPADRRGDMAYLQQQISELPFPEQGSVRQVIGLVFRAGGLPKGKITQEAVKAVEFLNSKEFVRTGSIGHVGFCFGGGISFNLACQTKTAACVVFYGENPSPIEVVEGMQSPFLGHYAGEDMRINADLNKLVAAVVKYKKDFEMRIYPGTYHAFFNNTAPTTYNANAAKEAWERTLRFFARTLP